MTTPTFAARRLRRLAQGEAPSRARRTASQGAEDERCDLCAEPIPPDHRHLLDPGAGTVSCACPACSLLFDHGQAGDARYLLLPTARRRLEGCGIDDMVWAGLGVPVDLAFFTRSATSGQVNAAYPSPLGLMRSVVDLADWSRVEAAHPALSTMAPEVEALLVHRANGGGASEPQYWLVPLDDCYRLAALVRAHWKGLGGGPEVWRQVDGFFRAFSTRPSPDTQEASWASP